jgi:hypothetical protein
MITKKNLSTHKNHPLGMLYLSANPVDYEKPGALVPELG